MLARWFDRNGIGQYLAPDENAAQEPPVDEAHSSIWQVLAPDPNFAQPTAPPPAAFSASQSVEQNQQVLCMHCGQWTDANQTRNTNASTPNPKALAGFTTPGTPLTTPSNGKSTVGEMASSVEYLVLSAAKETSAAFASPPHMSKAADKVFRACASTKMEEKVAKRLRNLLTKNPRLFRARATHLGQLVPDSFTPLMAAAFAGQTKAAEIIFELSQKELLPSILEDRDMQGRTALHVAAEQGHLEMVNMLLPRYSLSVEEANNRGKTPGKSAASVIASPPPVDLLGRTPLGRAITSPCPTAKRRRKALESSLFSPGDVSIMGNAKPATDRTARDESLQLAYGFADMPGMRVTMEDAVCISRLEIVGKSYWLFGVCDGHGDHGNVSSFVAANIPSVFQNQMKTHQGDWNETWKNTFLEVDEKIKQEGLIGGSTAVFALIGMDFIVIVNLGDSRAILVQSSSPSTGLEEKMGEMKMTETISGGYPATIDENESQKVPHDLTEEISATESCAVALSEDHKPDLPEERARIIKAGMSVVPISFEDDGKEITIHKVSKSDTDMLAVSRAFGDFEYKMNTMLAPEEQAVMAVPDVRVQPRDQKQDSYLVLACDGVWDVCDNDTVKDYILRQVEQRKDTTDTVLPDVGDALLVESLNRGSRDNMTTIIIALDKELPVIRTGIQGKALNFASPSK